VSLAGPYKDQDRYTDAEPLNKRALSIREKALGPGHINVAATLNNLADLYDLQGRYCEMEGLYRQQTRRTHQIMPAVRARLIALEEV